MNPTPSILVGCSQKVVCIRVQGKGSFQNSTGIKDFAAAMILRGHRDFVVDLAGCPVMDSTFMGTLAGIAHKLRRLGQGGLHVITPTSATGICSKVSASTRSFRWMASRAR